VNASRASCVTERGIEDYELSTLQRSNYLVEAFAGSMSRLEEASASSDLGKETKLSITPTRHAKCFLHAVDVTLSVPELVGGLPFHCLSKCLPDFLDLQEKSLVLIEIRHRPTQHKRVGPFTSNCNAL
jgi:hypothetical protein